MREISTSLLRMLPNLKYSLPECLSLSAQDKVGHLQTGLEELVLRHSRKSSIADVISELQFWHELYLDLPETEGAPFVHAEELEKKKLRMLKEWHPKVSESTLVRWDQRAKELTKETLFGKCLQKYTKLLIDREEFEELVTTAWVEVEQFEDDLVDRFRLEQKRKERDG